MSHQVPARLIFLRHGQGEHNATGMVDSQVTSTVALTELGQVQAREAGEHLKDLGIDWIISSPLRRAKETSAVVAEVLGYPEDQIHIAYELREIDCGNYDGGSYEEFLCLFERATDMFYTNPHEGESEQHLLERIEAYLEGVLQNPEYAGKTLLMVTHGAVVRTAYMALTNAKPEELYDFSDEERWMCPTGDYRAFELSLKEGDAPIKERLDVKPV